MPLEIRSFPLDQAHLDELAGVLRQDETVAGTLAALPGSPCHQLWVGIFNARPVSLLLLEQRDADWWACQLVVHPATRGRGVAAETLRLTARQQPFRCPPALATLASRAGLAN
jgi:GNAT superfamily N-acetyltransferase